MKKLITKHGIIQNLNRVNEQYLDISIDSFDIDFRWNFEANDLEINNKVILIGYLAEDDAGDVVFWTIAYFNISKDKISRNKKGYIILFLGSLLVMSFLLAYFNFLTGIDCLIIKLIYIGTFFLFLQSLYHIFAFRMLENAIKNYKSKSS